MRGLEVRFIVLLILGLAVLAIMLYAIFAGGKGPLDQVIASGKLRSCCEAMSMNSYSSSTVCGKDAGKDITASDLATAAGIDSGKLKEFCTGG